MFKGSHRLDVKPDNVELRFRASYAVSIQAIGSVSLGEKCMFDVLVRELSERYGLGDRSRDLFGLLMGYIYNDRRGGFGGFAESFRQQGHGDLFASWLGGDPRRQGTLTASDVGMVFGQGLLSDWGNRIGASRATVAAAIAGVLPRLVGELTPGGRVPEAFGGVAAKIHGSRVEDVNGDSEIVLPGSAAGHAPFLGERDPVAPSDDHPPHYGDQLRRDNGRIEPAATASSADPHVAAIAAAVFNDPLHDVEFRRPPPPYKRGGSGWLLWLLVLLALAAGAAYYWREYLPLDGLQVPWSNAPATT